MHAKLSPSQDLEKLLNCSEAARQSNETFGQLDHQGLSLVHGSNHPKVREPSMGHLLLYEKFRNYSCDGATGFENVRPAE